MKRIGVYICHCGTNIAGAVDCSKVSRYASGLPGVVVARDYVYTCSDPGQEMIKQDIAGHKLDRVVIGACSPRMHEPTFRNTLAEAGLSPFHLQMANLREHVSWVTHDREEATAKAMDLIRAAVARVTLHTDLASLEVPITKRALVVGGGIAGIQAALDIANAGYHVYLVEREPSIGGHMAQLDKTFPTLDCSACILTPKMVDVSRHPNIDLLAYSEVVEVAGYVGNFRVRVRHKPRYVDSSKCTGCGDCVEACVMKKRIPSEFEAGMGGRSAVYIPFPQAVPLKAVVDGTRCLFLTRGKCTRACEEACSRGAIRFDDSERDSELEVGAVVLATGYDLFDARTKPQYGYGILKNVIDGLQFERLACASGPTDGKIVLANGCEPEAIAFLHCIGSRDVNSNRYCSRVCCMYSMKQAHLARDKTRARVYEFYIDIRAAGKGYEEFYERVQEEGVHFIRGKAAEVSERDGKLVVRAEDTTLGRPVEIAVDMVVLGAGLTPRSDAAEVAQTFHVTRSQDGFFAEAHPKLRPVETNTRGIFLAGACQGPKDIPESVAQATAAAGKVTALFAQDFLRTEAMIAQVNEAMCSGCLWCKPVCPFGAIEAVTITERSGRRTVEREVARVNPSLCQGCGACTAACRTGAMSLLGYTDRQVLAEVDAICLGTPS
ncbi:MAG: CoB--CoM heterodisulfide reductase iron-sulfur subunit A family protein [Firmicutes bacterium]|jgi:heterodisulfide reductase subunit A|nr:CoB--CoM heterodisulfide reductase iron-sulfur subunit A family protein [Bacillota bacterium]